MVSCGNAGLKTLKLENVNRNVSFQISVAVLFTIFITKLLVQSIILQLQEALTELTRDNILPMLMSTSISDAIDPYIPTGVYRSIEIDQQTDHDLVTSREVFSSESETLLSK